MTALVPIPPKPPAQIAPYVAILGPDLTLTFLLRFGGGQLNIGENPREDSKLAQLVGLERAKALAQIPARQRQVPLAKPWTAQYLRFKGVSVSEIARTVRASETAVRRWLARADERMAQGKPVWRAIQRVLKRVLATCLNPSTSWTPSLS